MLPAQLSSFQPKRVEQCEVEVAVIEVLFTARCHWGKILQPHQKVNSVYRAVPWSTLWILRYSIALSWWAFNSLILSCQDRSRSPVYFYIYYFYFFFTLLESTFDQRSESCCFGHFRWDLMTDTYQSCPRRVDPLWPTLIICSHLSGCDWWPGTNFANKRKWKIHRGDCQAIRCVNGKGKTIPWICSFRCRTLKVEETYWLGFHTTQNQSVQFQLVLFKVVRSFVQTFSSILFSSKITSSYSR